MWCNLIPRFMFLLHRLSGCSPEGPCSDPHWREAVPLPHLRHTFPPLADLKEPPAHPHGRETLHREWGGALRDPLTRSTSCAWNSDLDVCSRFFQCDKCDVHFRHKSQLRLHLRQKHGAVTNTKVRYKLLTEPYQSVLQAC